MQLAAGRPPTKGELTEALRSGPIPHDLEPEIRKLIVKALDGKYKPGLKKLSVYTDTTHEQGRLNWIGAFVHDRHERYGRGTLDAIYKEVAQAFDMTERNVKECYLKYKNGD